MDMLGVALIDAGLFCILLGGTSVIKPLRFLRITSRKKGWLVAGCGMVAMVAGAVLPVRETRADAAHTRLNEFAPVYQFHEVHTTRVNASRERVYAAITKVEPDEILLFKTLTWMRRFGQGGQPNILNPPEHQPIMDTALRTGFLPLANDREREIVVGLIMSPPRPGLRLKPTPEEFKAFDRPGAAKVSMNFLIEEVDASHCTLTTETRIYGTDAAAQRRFAAYWRVIYPGSALIRRMWLRAIRRRAEAAGHEGGAPAKQ